MDQHFNHLPIFNAISLRDKYITRIEFIHSIFPKLPDGASELEQYVGQSLQAQRIYDLLVNLAIGFDEEAEFLSHAIDQLDEYLAKFDVDYHGTFIGSIHG